MKFDWRQSIVYVTAAGIESCWLYAIMVLLNEKLAAGSLSIFWILALYLISAGFNSLLRRLPWPRFSLQVISWVVWAAALLVTVKTQLLASSSWSDTAWLLAVPRAIAEVLDTFLPELLILISTAVIWWLGMRLSRLKVSFATLVSEFQFGLFLLVITFFIASQLEMNLDHAVYLIVSFFLISLLGISVAHALEGTSWLSGLYQGHWSGLLLISIALVLLLGFLISLAVTPDLLQLVLAALEWMWGLIMKALDFLVSLLPETKPTELPPMPPMPQSANESALWFNMPEALRSGLRLGWTILVIGFLLFALWRISSDIFRWLRRRLASMAGAEFEPLPGAFRADFLGWWQRLISRLLGLRRLLHHRVEAVPPEIASVRQIYRQFLHWLTSQGYPRHTSQTPYEYLSMLVKVLPEAREDLAFVTQQYVSARYGTSLPTENELYNLRQSWYRIRQNRLKKQRGEHVEGEERNSNE